MKLTAQIKLLPCHQQRENLLKTMEQFNAACNMISAYAFANRVWNEFKLRKPLYQQLRASHGLSAQATQHVIKKVAHSYKANKDAQHTFKARGAITYDARILTYFTEHQEVSIWTLEGRIRVGYQVGEHHRKLLEYQKGESDLVYCRGQFYLLATCEVPDGECEAIEGVLGVDLGIANLATDSDGDSHSGSIVEQKRSQYARHRSALQRIGTRSAKRRLKKVSGKQNRFQKNTNHVIAKRLVQKAKDTNRAVALEDLSGIRKRTTVRKGQRARHHNWAFAQLRQFITYKTLLMGVPVVLVDARNTSKTCSACGYCDRANRRSQAEFSCKDCGHSANADYNAALNIAARGVVNLPMVAGCYAA